MDRFVDRQQDLQVLHQLLDQERAQLVFVYGRPGVGKTALLRQWAPHSGLPYLYWTPPGDAADTEASLLQALAEAAAPEGARQPRPGVYFTEPLSNAFLRAVGSRRRLLILDDFPRAAAACPSLPALLQQLWDHALEHSAVILVVVGAGYATMHHLLNYEAPLYGRATAIYRVDPLPLAALREFFPRYTPAARLALYAALGGIPAYLAPCDPAQPWTANVRHVSPPPAGLDELAGLLPGPAANAPAYRAILQNLARGPQTLPALARATGYTPADLSGYLYWLEQEQLVAHRLSALTPPDQVLRHLTRGRGRFYLRDPYLRFGLSGGALPGEARARDPGERDFGTFVGHPALAELAREWVWQQVGARQLPFLPERVSELRARGVRIDVAAVNWSKRALLLGACHWGPRAAGGAVIQRLAAQGRRVLPTPDWQGHYVMFARAGFTPAARSAAAAAGVRLVDAGQLEADLQGALQPVPVADAAEELPLAW